MTPDQRKRFYFPIWSATVARLDWRKDAAGRLVADLERQAAARNWPDHAASALQQVVQIARQRAATEIKAVVPDHLRHACNLVASGGRTASSTKFSQKDINHFDRLCAVLRNPWDMNATIAWLNPEEDDRKRSLAYLRKLAHEGKLIAIAMNTWGTNDVDSLTQAQIDGLHAEIKQSAWTKKSTNQRRAVAAGHPW